MDEFSLISSNKKILQLLGLARKSGKIALGFDKVCFSVKHRKSHLVILTKDCSINSSKDIKYLAENHKVPLRQLEISKKELESFFGKEYAIISINDKGFNLAIENLLNKNQ